MIQIFILGSSSVYGVGGDIGSWADLLKQTLHTKMYAPGGTGEYYEVFNFGKSGAKIEFVKSTFPDQLNAYSRTGATIISIVAVGTNNAKAEGSPDNFVSTIDEYSSQMSELLDLLKEKSTHVIAVGGGYYDESKTNPKTSPLNGKKSYFSNARKQEFEARFKALCAARDIPFVGVTVSEKEWKEKYLYTDGLHPNQQGHTYIAQNVLALLDTIL